MNSLTPSPLPAHHFGIAGVQMEVSAFEDNLPRMEAYLRHIRQRFPWVRLVMFSELAALGPRHARAEPLPGPAEDQLCRLALETGLWLLSGSLFERVSSLAGDTVYNTASVINPQGEVVTRFRKLFPFRPYEKGVAGGDAFCVFDIPGAGRIGVSICYDMWFPETTRTLAAMGAEVILHPTMTDTIDRDVEVSIARASAATNQLYFFDINGVGHGGVGRSLVCDPSGYVLHQAGNGPEIIAIDVDFNRVRYEREHGLRSHLGQPLKSFRDRSCHFDVYQPASGRDAYLHTLGPLEKPE